MVEREFSDDERCPCTSGKLYRNCCKKKRLKWFHSESGISRAIPFKDEIKPIFNIQNELFYEYYGRKLKKDDYIFFNMPIYADIIGQEMVYIARKAGIPENKIYAAYKSKIILSSANLDVVPVGYEKEYYYYYKEFNKLSKTVPKQNKINSLQYVLLTNAKMEDDIKYIIRALESCMNDFVHRHSDNQVITDFVLTSEKDYCIFSVVKSIKTLQGINVLSENHLTEGIYALSRSIFENYMYICNINFDNNFFADKLLPKIDDVNFIFDIYPDGKINYNKVINRKTSIKHSVKINIHDLQSKLPYEADRKIYSLFYQTACQYVHVDVMSARNYFSNIDVYDEVSSELIAELISLTLILFLLARISYNKDVDAQFKKDSNYLCVLLSKKIISCFEILKCDSEHQNVLYDVFIERLYEEFLN
jgi:hypothetical protein